MILNDENLKDSESSSAQRFRLTLAIFKQLFYIQTVRIEINGTTIPKVSKTTNRLKIAGMDSIWYFNDVNLFKVLCPHKFKKHKRTHEFNAYKKQDYIYFEEDAATKIYLIDKGKVKLGYYTEDGQEVIKSILSRGELFGEKAILGEEKRNEFAQSIDNKTSICPISVTTMHDLMRDNQTFTLKIYKFIGLRIKKLERRLQLLLFKDTKTRLLEFLKELCDEYGYACEKTGDHIVKHPYTQKDIAGLIGTSRPTLNILMNELKAENIIDFNRKEIRFFN